MKKLSVILSMFVFMLVPLAVLAGSYSSIVAFGDSLSDNGGDDGYGFGTFSNGSVWVEYLADSNHLNCDLYDYAFGGATTGTDYPDLNWQVDQYLLYNQSIADGTLFTLWAGGNDFLGLGTGDDPYQAVMDAVLGMGLAVSKLVGAGAQDILVMTLPNLGATPLNNTDPAASIGAQMITEAYNAALVEAMAGFDALPNVNLTSLDVFAILEDILDDPTKFGFDNVTDMLIAAGETTDAYLFWDAIHPTTQAHELIADYANSAVAPVPEPATLLLLFSGLIGFAGFRKRFKK